MPETKNAVLLAHSLVPAGPVANPAAADRLHDTLIEAAAADGWSETLTAAWHALTPVAGASPYLTGLMRRRPAHLRRLLEGDPAESLARILGDADALDGEPDDVRAPLRVLKADLHLLTALADLGGVWDLDQVTEALSKFADAACRAALRAVAAEQRARGRLISPPDDSRGPVPGLFGVAMGKHGANELNYSSDIDISLFFEPRLTTLALAEGVEMQDFANRIGKGIATLLSERTADGYVFRVDLRLRPDPSSTPPVVAAPMALAYYESVGQNWERAAFIKARPVSGRPARGGTVPEGAGPLRLAAQPGLRRRPRHPGDQAPDPRPQDRRRSGRGGRQSEAGARRHPRDRILRPDAAADPGRPRSGAEDAAHHRGALRPGRSRPHSPRTVADELSAAYVELRGLEHRVQMLDDEQTHRLPEDAERRAAVAALAGGSDLSAFDAHVEALLARVNARYGELFEGGEDLDSSYGSLVFTGVENDPETLETLKRMGFSEAASVADTIRAWHHGRIPATRTERGRELFTRLAPRLLEAVARSGAPDDAFRRFAVFFSGLTAGVQVQALFLNQPKLFEMVLGVMAFAPRLARTLGRQPAALDGVLDARFLTDLSDDTGLTEQILREAGETEDFEGAMNAVRRLHREQMFRIGIHALTGRAGTEAAGRAYAALADAAMRTLSPAALAETVRLGGAFPGAVAVVALGKAGSREMTAGSDLDLMTLYEAPPEATSTLKDWTADVFYARFTQRLIAALSAHTAEGGLYEVDMRLRPTGSKGPVSVRLSAFDAYYAKEAGDVGVHGPDPRPRGLGQRPRLWRACRGGHRGGSAPSAPRRRCRRRRAQDAGTDGPRAASARLLGFEAVARRTGGRRVRGPVPPASGRRHRRTADPVHAGGAARRIRSWLRRGGCSSGWPICWPPPSRDGSTRRPSRRCSSCVWPRLRARPISRR